MSHFGFLVPAVPGHLNPSLALAHELRSRGHQITFYLPAIARQKVESAGHRCRVYAEQEYPGEQLSADLATLAGLSGFAAFRFTVGLFTRLSSASLRENPAHIREDRIDAMIVDESLFEGSTVAEAANLPYITLSNALLLLPDRGVPPFFTTWRYSTAPLPRLRNYLVGQSIRWLGGPLLKTVNAHRRELGLPPYQRIIDARSTLLHLTQQVPQFDFPRQNLPSNVRFVGPLHSHQSRAPHPFPWEKLDGRPLIYASMGTLQNRQHETFFSIAAACADLPCQLVISLGGGSSAQSLGDLPGRPVVVDFAPQLELLQRATLCITHAGLNTTLEALAQGVPLVAIPITNDQPGVASRIRHTGVGEFVALSKLKPLTLRNLVERVLNDGRYRAAAGRMREVIAQCAGPLRAAELIQAALNIA